MGQKTLFDFEIINKTSSITHLAIFTQPYLDLILSGEKTIESRFGVRRSIPYNKVKERDKIIMKESSGMLKGEFTAGKVVL